MARHPFVGRHIATKEVLYRASRMRTVWIHRGAYKRLYGAHLKHSHYVHHAAGMACFIAKITFTGVAGNKTLEDERLALWPPNESEHALRWDPQTGDILFLTGFDWRYLSNGGYDSLPNPRINLIQGVQHAEAGTEQFEYLALKAVRICVSQEVADAICATGRVNGPVITIPNGIDAPFITSKSTRSPVTIAGYKDPKLAQALADRLTAMGIENRGLTEFIPRGSFLSLLSHSRVAVCLPKAKEGFYLPALEAMGLGCMVVTVDCIGNRGFCFNERNCLIAERNVDSLAETASRALNAGIMKRWWMHRKAIFTARRHSLSKEQRQFHWVLKDIDRLWASTVCRQHKLDR